MLGVERCGLFKGGGCSGVIATISTNVPAFDQRTEQLRLTLDQIVNQGFGIIEAIKKTELPRQLQTNPDMLGRDSGRGPECLGCAVMVASLVQQVTTFDQRLDAARLLAENIVEHHCSLIGLTERALVARQIQPASDISGILAKVRLKLRICAWSIAAAFAATDFDELFWQLIGKHGQAIKKQSRGRLSK
jgi:hypothetical protein